MPHKWLTFGFGIFTPPICGNGEQDTDRFLSCIHTVFFWLLVVVLLASILLDPLCVFA